MSPQTKKLLSRHPVPAISLSGVLFVVLTACADRGATAAEFLTDNSSTPYQLSTENTGAFRLSGTGTNAISRRPAKENVVPVTRLADKPFSAQIDRAARRAAIDPALVHAVIQVESGYDPRARSPKGAAGLMQVMPETALRYGVTNAGRDPEGNLKAGTRYLSDLLKLFDNRLDLALAAYNAGEKAVIRYRMRIPPYRETEQYVPAVLAKYREWQETRPTPPSLHRIEYLPGTTLEPAAQPGLRP